jgi:hypothetical protein
MSMLRATDRAARRRGPQGGGHHRLARRITDRRPSASCTPTATLTARSSGVDQLSEDMRYRDCPPEIRQLGRTMRRWRTQIAAWHQAQVSNGPTETMNGLAKRVKRAAFGCATSSTGASACCSTPASPTGPSSPRASRDPAQVRRARLLAGQVALCFTAERHAHSPAA